MTSTTDAPRKRTGKPVRRKAEGQWALGYREPLNANEQAKKDDNPLNVRTRIDEHLRQYRIRRHRQERPAWPLPLDGSLYPA